MPQPRPPTAKRPPARPLRPPQCVRCRDRTFPLDLIFTLHERITVCQTCIERTYTELQETFPERFPQDRKTPELMRLARQVLILELHDQVLPLVQ